MAYLVLIIESGDKVTATHNTSDIADQRRVMAGETFTIKARRSSPHHATTLIFTFEEREGEYYSDCFDMHESTVERAEIKYYL